MAGVRSMLKLVLILSLVAKFEELAMGRLMNISIGGSIDIGSGYYDSTCPNAESIVRKTVEEHWQADNTIAPGLLRLHFHDCFVKGCDGSVLIDGLHVEKTAFANIGLRGFDVIENAKSRIENICPGVVSCADILALAARDAVDLSGGPSWIVPLGRKDGKVSNAIDVANMPAPIDSIDVLKQKFAEKGLTPQDLVILNGAHTIGITECRFMSYRLYNYSKTGAPDPSIDTKFLQTLRSLCPLNGDGLTKVALDYGSQFEFNTMFYKNILRGYGVLESDQRLMSDETTSNLVKSYTSLIGGLLGVRYSLAFSNSMIKMGMIGIKTGSDGDIRMVCSKFN